MAGCNSRGIHVSGFLTPVYRLPSGYSETYRKHLESATPKPKELLHPALKVLPPPVPLIPPPAATPQQKPPNDGVRPEERMPFPPPPAPNNAEGIGNGKNP